MSTESAAESPLDAFLRVAAAAGLDTSDVERMEDLHRRVQMMRSGISSLYEIDVSDAESPSAFIAAAE